VSIHQEEVMCPDENTLMKFASGAAGELPALEAHLDGCESCRRAVAAAASEQTLPATLATHALTSGQRVGRYEIERELGRGGMGIVYQARDVTLDRRVALKLLHQRRDDAAQARLLREAQVMAKLTHPNVVPVFELGEWKGEVYLVMELVNGVTLEQWLKREKHRRSDIIHAFVQAGRGLAAAHAAGVVHRDFKPANVLVGLDNRVRVTDFGLSRPGPALELPATDSAVVTRDGAIVGTLAYMAPEQIDGKAADERSDQFAFCVSLVEALTGLRPFEGENWAALAQGLSRKPRLGGVPVALRSVLRKGLERDPARRYTSLTALLNAVERSQQLGWASVGTTAAIAAAVGLFFAFPGKLQPTLRELTGSEDLEPIVIANRDLEAGTVVTMDMLSQRVMLKINATSSIVRPDSVSYIVGQKLNVPVQQGDALLWSQFQTTDQVAAETEVPVVVAAIDIAENTVLTMDMVKQISMPSRFVTSSVVKPDSASYIIGQKLLVPVQAGDPMLWTQFETNSQGATTRALVAARDLPEGSVLDPSRIVEMEIPATLATSSVMRPKQSAHVWGHTLKTKMKRGDLLLWSLLSAEVISVEDGLPMDSVTDVVKKHMPQLAPCLQNPPALEGARDANLVWSVRADGTAFDVHLDRQQLDGSALEKCLSKAVSALSFPKAKKPTWDASLQLVFASTPKEKLEASDVMSAVIEKKEAWATCAAKAATGTSGKVVLEWNVKPDGKPFDVHVAAESAALKDTPMASCFVGVVEGLRFPEHVVPGEPVRFPFMY
jgi:serine/threonine-protein kinase